MVLMAGVVVGGTYRVLAGGVQGVVWGTMVVVENDFDHWAGLREMVKISLRVFQISSNL